MPRAKKKIVYVTRDIERALGMQPSSDYQIIANRTPYAESIKEQYPEYVHLIDPQIPPYKGGAVLDTAELLENDEARTIITAATASLLVFKNTTRIEAIAKESSWKLLNPSAELAEKIENKITQVAWLGELAQKYLPAHSIGSAKKLIWKKEPLIIQWAHGHTGESTVLINSSAELSAVQKQFPERPARTSIFINGPSFTVNAIAAKNKILIGNISYQITGLPPFTDNAFTTVGNDWSLTHSLLNEAEISQIETIINEIGDKLIKSGWRGLFGIDVIRDEERGQIYLIEINARQPASTTFESILQEGFREQGIKGLTTFEAHIKALTGESIDQPLIPINDGAQIVQRVTKHVKDIPADMIGSLELAGYRTITYSNTEENADLLRIQSMKGIMETHGKFNLRGKEIISRLSPENT